MAVKKKGRSSHADTTATSNSERRGQELEQARLRATSSRARRVVAVFPPRSLRADSETNWLSTALAEVLSAELAVSGEVRLLPGEEVARLRQDLSLPEEEGFAGDTLKRMRLHSQVDRVITWTYLTVRQEGSSTLRLDLRLQDATTGEVIAHVTDTGSEQDLLTLLDRVGATVCRHIGLAAPTSEQVQRVHGAIPLHPEAARLYSEGLSALRNHDAALAVEWLEKAVGQEPGFVRAWSALAAACQGLFLAERAREAAREAFELSEGLAPEERLGVQARHHEAQANWEFAIAAYRELVELCPDSVEYATALVSAQVSAGQPWQAHETLKALRRLPPPLDGDPRIDLAESLATAAVSNFEDSLRHAEAAAEKARRGSQWLIVASALTSSAFAVRNLGNPSRAVELMDESERLFLQGGNRGGAARSMLGHAVALIDLVRLRDAERVLKAMRPLARGYRGSLLEAERLGISGHLYCRLGSLPEALRLTREALAVYQSLELPAESTHYHVQLAMLRRHHGALDEAQRLLEKETQNAQAIGDGYTEAWAQHELGELLVERGDLSQAHSRLRRALELRQAHGLEAFMIDTVLDMAKLMLEEGDSKQALPMVERVCTFYAQQRNHAKEGWAHALRARVLLVRGETVPAREALMRAQALSGRSEDSFIMAEVLLTRAWAAALTGSAAEREETAQPLQELIAKSQTGELKGMEFQARLGLAELHHASGMDSAGAECLDIEKEARLLGYLAVARKARALAQLRGSRQDRS